MTRGLGRDGPSFRCRSTEPSSASTGAARARLSVQRERAPRAERALRRAVRHALASRSRRSSPTCSSTRRTVASGLIHDVVEDTDDHARRRRARVRQGDRRDRRRADEDRQAADQRLDAGAAGRELSQAAALDREGRARHHHQARRPAAQHADARLSPPEKRRRIAQETRDLYAPLAHRFGMAKMRWELEDLAFKHLEPDEYKSAREAGRAEARRARSS